MKSYYEYFKKQEQMKKRMYMVVARCPSGDLPLMVTESEKEALKFEADHDAVSSEIDRVSGVLGLDVELSNVGVWEFEDGKLVMTTVLWDGDDEPAYVEPPC